jgi:diadenosine tetraphosphate (Ap4A) HIT family hydrolase
MHFSIVTNLEKRADTLSSTTAAVMIQKRSRRDNYPVTQLHTLVISKRHATTFFDLFEPERRAINQLLDGLRVEITKKDPLVTGFNIGMNSGDAAGQTIGHAHVHLIPRRQGDVQDPRGGVRGVIPGKAAY